MADEKNQNQMSEENLDKVSGGALKIELDGKEAEEYIKMKNLYGSGGYSGGYYGGYSGRY